ncbi:hypothetical protein GlitD10_0324 [Gloeomargarita lithophora Alchichica-D10]|uniref:Card1 endonuclease domain-containing protein n=1 Tax=Gloeomargarita lithophora Alchichica-D10 TaxID=1188229 RepID=A0A1J0A9L3_9CYAN|nr:DUF1887 family CARF protein [Gloeomargarita lithophora]APB32632.1 hypothetical protein GlitD10_0324 [Gloeomargarita lithophora Alchichica-D10]
MLASNFNKLKDIENSLKRQIQEPKNNFDYTFSPTDDKNCINNFLDLLKMRGFFRTLNRVPTANRIFATLNHGDPNFSVISDFLKGGWLESYVHIKVIDFYHQMNIQAICLKNLGFATVKNAGEFDVIASVNNELIVFECKTGDYQSFQAKMPKYVDCCQKLELPPKRFVLVAPKLGQQQRQELSQRHEITFAGLDDLDQALRLAISA